MGHITLALSGAVFAGTPMHMHCLMRRACAHACAAGAGTDRHVCAWRSLPARPAVCWPGPVPGRDNSRALHADPVSSNWPTQAAEKAPPAPPQAGIHAGAGAQPAAGAGAPPGREGRRQKLSPPWTCIPRAWEGNGVQWLKEGAGNQASLVAGASASSVELGLPSQGLQPSPGALSRAEAAPSLLLQQYQPRGLWPALACAHVCQCMSVLHAGAHACLRPSLLWQAQLGACGSDNKLAWPALAKPLLSALRSDDLDHTPQQVAGSIRRSSPSEPATALRRAGAAELSTGSP